MFRIEIDSFTNQMAVLRLIGDIERMKGLRMPGSYVINRSLPNLFAETVGYYTDNVAIQFNQRQVTFRELDELSDKVAAELAQNGIKKGDRVALYCVNSDAFVIAYLGIVKAGATVLPINLLLTPVEIEFILNDANANGLIYHASFAANINKLRDCVPAIRMYICIGQKCENSLDICWQQLLQNNFTLPEIVFEPKNDLAAILYTSGTTGKPKGAMLTHANLASNTSSAKQALKIEAQKDKLLVVLPLFHAFAATVGMLTPILHGASLVIAEKFDPELIFSTIERSKATIFLGVPSMYGVLLRCTDQQKKKFSHIKYCISGGAAMPMSLMQKFEKKFGIAIYEGDGPTECSPVTCINPIGGVRKTASVGLPIPGVEMKIKDNNGDDLAADTIGEICVRGPNVMQGYWNKPEETAASFFNDWFRTGDLGSKDRDGYFYIIDRIKDMIIVNGMNVYPRIIEEVLYEYPSIEEVAVIGEPNQSHGEIVVAYVVLKSEIDTDAAILRAHCRERLGGYQIPRKFNFINVLPKNASGKILKRELRLHGELERGIDARA